MGDPYAGIPGPADLRGRAPVRARPGAGGDARGGSPGGGRPDPSRRPLGAPRRAPRHPPVHRSDPRRSAARRGRGGGRRDAAASRSRSRRGCAVAAPSRGSDRPRAIWLGIGPGDVELAGLTARLGEELARRGWPVDDRPFRPHLTLARSDGIAAGGETARRLIAAAADLDVAWTVDRLILFESVTGGGPARYVPLHEAARRLTASRRLMPAGRGRPGGESPEARSVLLRSPATRPSVPGRSPRSTRPPCPACEPSSRSAW